MPASFPAPLVLAEGWLKRMGKEVRRTNLEKVDGTKDPVLEIKQGSVVVHIRAQGECLLVFALFPFPEEARKRLGVLPQALQVKLLQALRRELFIHPRAALGMFPPTARDLGSLEGFSVEQLLRASEDDPSSFNRLADAVQEVATDGIRAASVLGVALQSSGSEGVNVNAKNVPERMYG